jgi:heterodisulfide reductase subunit C
MEPLDLAKRESTRLKDHFLKEQVATAPGILNLCLTCGTCAGGCPATGVDGWDMRKAVRAALLGLEQELIDSKFPWVCTLCGRCEHGCPMHIDLVRFIRTARWLRPRDQVPGSTHKGVGQFSVIETGQFWVDVHNDSLAVTATERKDYG